MKKRIAIAMAVAVLPAGCGGSSDSGQISGTIKTYLAAIAHGDGKTACAQLTSDVARELSHAAAGLGATSCPQAVRAVARHLSGHAQQILLNAQVTSVQVSGHRAAAHVKGATRVFDMTKIGGRWLISGGITG